MMVSVMVGRRGRGTIRRSLDIGGSRDDEGLYVSVGKGFEGYFWAGMAARGR